uniref:Uncharacterized protein n=1 Tax=Arundo donax TaxID=35708 RepID=A0A0A8YTW9_ARUDO
MLDYILRHSTTTPAPPLLTNSDPHNSPSSPQSPSSSSPSASPAAPPQPSPLPSPQPSAAPAASQHQMHMRSRSDIFKPNPRYASLATTNIP